MHLSISGLSAYFASSPPTSPSPQTSTPPSPTTDRFFTHSDALASSAYLDRIKREYMRRKHDDDNYVGDGDFGVVRGDFCCVSCVIFTSCNRTHFLNN